jgi:hypothetical protein
MGSVEGECFVRFRVLSWIVLLVNQGDDPRKNTNEREMESLGSGATAPRFCIAY